jgi:uncharacterized protein
MLGWGERRCGLAPNNPRQRERNGPMQQLIVPVADILGRPGVGRDLRLRAVLPGVSNALVELEESPVDAILRAESVVEGILVSGDVAGRAAVRCARCLSEYRAPIRLRLCELFTTEDKRLPEEEAYRLAGDEMDLEPMLRDAIALALPLNPICREGCEGLCAGCGQDLNAGPCGCRDESSDPRWAALAGLRERLEG